MCGKVARPDRIGKVRVTCVGPPAGLHISSCLLDLCFPESTDKLGG